MQINCHRFESDMKLPGTHYPWVRSSSRAARYWYSRVLSKMDSTSTPHLLPVFRKHLLFKQGNGPSHASTYSPALLASKGLKDGWIMTRPPSSSYLNTIESWALLKWEIYLLKYSGLRFIDMTCGIDWKHCSCSMITWILKNQTWPKTYCKTSHVLHKAQKCLQWASESPDLKLMELDWFPLLCCTDANKEKIVKDLKHYWMLYMRCSWATHQLMWLIRCSV